MADDEVLNGDVVDTAALPLEERLMRVLSAPHVRDVLRAMDPRSGFAWICFDEAMNQKLLQNPVVQRAVGPGAPAQAALLITLAVDDSVPFLFDLAGIGAIPSSAVLSIVALLMADPPVDFVRVLVSDADVTTLAYARQPAAEASA